AKTHNSGDRDARDVLVRMYDGDPSDGTLLAEDIFDTIMSGHGATLISTGTLAAGGHDIVVLVDPDGDIPEISERNNTALKTVTVLPAVEVIDLSANEIVFTPEDPEEGEVVDIRCGVKNESTITVENIKLRVYEGDPDAGGSLLIPEVTIPQLGQGNNGWITIKRDTTGWGGVHEIYVVADPENAIQEQDEDNNRASRSLTVTTQAITDLALTAGGISFSPLEPAVGNTVTLNCIVENTGSEA
ncbi:unnamed protein product, partial [marine sediment metagenome]